MLRSRSFVLGSGLLFALSAIACSGDSLTTPGTTTLQITTSTAGTELDPDGYTVQVDAGAPQAIGLSASIQSTDVSPGDHAVQLAGMAPNCTVSGDNPHTVSVAAGQTATVSFAVTCGATTGGLQVTAMTSGPAPDADGYTVTVDGAERGTLAASGTVNVDGLAPGDHVVGVSGVAANCQVQEDNPHTVTITPGAAASTAFTVSCAEPPPNAGTLRVKTATTGADLDADGYDLAVDGGKTQPIGVNGTATLANIAGGNHSVTLSGVASNCSVTDGGSKSVTVSVGASVNVSFAVTCSPAGAIQWTSIPLPQNFAATSVWASSPSDVFVTGNDQAPCCSPIVILHYNGASWTEQFRGDGAGGRLWGNSATELFAAVGSSKVLHYDGTHWIDVGPAAPNDDFYTKYMSGWGTSADLFAGGWFEAEPPHGLISHYDGTAWVKGQEGHDYGYNGLVYKFSGTSPSDVWAIGETTSPGLDPEEMFTSYAIDHYDGQVWSQSLETRRYGVIPGNYYSLNSVWAIASNDVFAVASNGSIFHFDGAWSPMTSPTTQALADIWGSSHSNVYAVGAAGILRYDGVSWGLVSPTAGSGVWGTATDVFVIIEGAILHGTS
jgi:hypothetical protein